MVIASLHWVCGLIWASYTLSAVINPQRMQEGYGNRSICLSVCVTELAAAHFI